LAAEVRKKHESGKRGATKALSRSDERKTRRETTDPSPETGEREK